MLSHLKIYQRLLLIVAPFLLPIVLLLYSVNSTINASIDFAVDEAAGNAAQRPLTAMLHEVSQLRGVLAETSPDAVGIEAHIAEVDKQFAVLKPLHDDYMEMLELEGEGLAKRGREHLSYNTMLAQWNALKEEYAAGGDAAEAQNAMIANLRGWIAHVGDTSNLILDPDLDSYYTMDVTLLALPQTIDRLSAVKTLVLNYVQNPLAAEASQATEIAVMARMLKEADHDRVVASQTIALGEDANFYGISPSFEKKIKPLLDDYSEKSGALTAALEQVAAGSPASESDMQEKFTALDEAGYALFVAAIDELDTLLETRIKSYEAEKYTLLGEALAALLLACVIFYFVFRGLSNPLAGLRQTLGNLCKGELETPVPYTGRADEIGQMADSIEQLRQTSLHARQLEADQQQERQKKEARSEKIEELNRFFTAQVGESIAQLATAATQLYHACESLNLIIANANRLSSDIGKSSEVTSTNVQTVASAAEEMSASIKEISTQLNNSMQITRNAVEESMRADASAKDMSAVSSSIGAVTSLIQEIASQINLLSLNATIESARAGEAGKGFAVVASEVKNLAQQTSNATEDISTQITSVQRVSGEMNDVLRLVKAAVEKVDHFNGSIASAVEEQTAVTNEIVSNMHYATDSIHAINSNIHQISENTAQAETAVAEVLGASQTLSKQAEILKQQIDDYISDVQSL